MTTGSQVTMDGAKTGKTVRKVAKKSALDHFAKVSQSLRNVKDLLHDHMPLLRQLSHTRRVRIRESHHKIDEEGRGENGKSRFRNSEPSKARKTGMNITTKASSASEEAAVLAAVNAMMSIFCDKLLSEVLAIATAGKSSRTLERTLERTVEEPEPFDLLSLREAMYILLPDSFSSICDDAGSQRQRAGATLRAKAELSDKALSSAEAVQE